MLKSAHRQRYTAGLAFPWSLYRAQFQAALKALAFSNVGAERNRMLLAGRQPNAVPIK
jgi:hypothetical protein